MDVQDVGKNTRRRAALRARHYPESVIDDFSRVDGAVEFYTRVNALLTDEMTVLDLGAGRGHWIADTTSVTRRRLRDMRGKVARVVGVDVDDAVRSNPSLDEAHVVGLEDALPFEDGAVDLVVSDFTFEHIADPEHVAGELARVVKPGGWVCARTPNKHGYIGLGARLVPNDRHVSWLKRLQPTRKDVDVFPVAYGMNTPARLRELFPPADFDHHVYTYYGEPNYAGGSRLLWTAFSVLRRVQPRALDPMLHIFIQRR